MTRPDRLGYRTSVAPASLSDFAHERIELGGRRRDVFSRGDGPQVLLLSEMPGLVPQDVELARRLAERGFRVVAPNLVGTPGRPFSVRYAARSQAQICITRELHVLARGKTSPVATWLRELVAVLHERQPGPMAVIGLCFTAGVALALAVDEPVSAAVMSQPSTPFPVSRAHRADPGLASEDLDAVARRAREGRVCALGLRFAEDATAPRERFATLGRHLGDAFTTIELGVDGRNPPGWNKTAHSVLGYHYDDATGSPTREALEAIVAFLERRVGRGANDASPATA